jgi:DNA-binding transcriptional regulator YdaS (Cro superfamily)
MEKQPRWAEMCARILQQCEVLRGGREGLAAHLGVHPTELAIWVSGRSGPPRAVFEKAVDVILAEHDRRASEEKTKGPNPRRRRTDH